jgi:tyrosyl-tRNA synthetase
MSLSADLEFRGLIHQVTDPTLLEKLDRESLTLYAGFDPTASSLHVGNLLQFCTLRRFQNAGHRVICLAGGGTGMIGDPGGRSGERQLLSAQDLDRYLTAIKGQIETLLDYSSGSAVLLDNSSWLLALSMIDFLRDVGKHFTINQMVAKESVKTRFERPDQGISYTEFSYMLLQAYDFLQLFEQEHCVLQIGGSDQWGNITMGVDLIRKIQGAEAYGLTTPLVLKADGTKFGKSEEGTVWLDPELTSPYRLYQFFLNTEDSVVGQYLRYFTFLEHEAISALDEETASHPERRNATRALAREVCTMIHGAGETERAERASSALFGEEIASLDEPTLLEVVADAPSSHVSKDVLPMLVVDALVSASLASSKGEARRTIDQGGAYVNNRRVEGAERELNTSDLLYGRYIVLRKGRRDYHVLWVE